MTFATPLLAAAILVLPLCWLAWRYRDRRRRAAARLFGSAAPGRGQRGMLALSACVALAVVALMQPMWGTRAEDAPRSGRDIVVILDTSLSMQAEDVAPNRLEFARAAIDRLAEAVATEGGHRLALIVFAGRPMMTSPLTLDYDLFRDRLRDVRVGAVTPEGSAIGEAISFAVERIDRLEPGHVDMILVTDGEDLGGLAIDAARDAAKAGAALYTLGIGSPGDGALIPIVTPDGERSVVEYDGFPVRSRVDLRLLEELARAGGGRALGAPGDPDVLAALFRDEIADKPRRELAQVSAEVPAQRFQWFLLLALLALAVDWRGLMLRREAGA